MRYLSILLLLAACATASTSTPSSVPYAAIRDLYAGTYLDKPDHKAFAVATGPFSEVGGFASGIGWGHSDPQGAMTTAMVWCKKQKTRVDVDQECRFYAINDTVVWGMSDEEIQAVVDSY